MPRYYTITASTITDADWVSAYFAEVPALVARHGGQYLAATGEIERLEGAGEVPSGISLLEGPSREAAEAFFADPDYQPHLSGRLAGSSGHGYLFPAADQIYP